MPHHRCHTMVTLKFFAFALALLLCCCLITPLEARSRDKEGRRGRQNAATTSTAVASSASASAMSTYGFGSGSGGAYMTSSTSNYNGPIDTTGFCTRRREMKLMCYCTPDENHVPVQKAECWVFAEGLLQNDTTWTRFYQQKRLRELKFVIQNNARLDYIPTMIIEPLKNLSSVTIEYSQVEIVKSYAFANLQFLERIILNNNHIMALDQDAFANHIRLRELNLEHNQIFEIDRYAFRNLPLCERLYLNNNNITNLHEGLFTDMARLTYLNMAHNQISVLTSEIFKGLGNLNVLKLTRNNLNFIGDTVFAELWSLMELELDDNRIERISERALDGLNNLKTLNLRNNFLKKIDNGLLRGTPALLSINVQSNVLETLTFYTFQPIMDNLVNSSSELLLSDNNFICDCRLQWIFELKNRTRHLPLRDSLEEFVCTLQEPKLSNFNDPVPNHILDLLNIGGFNNLPAIGNNVGTMNGGLIGMDELNGGGIGHVGRKHVTNKSRTNVRGQRQFANIENGVELKKKKKRSVPVHFTDGMTSVGNGGGGGVAAAAAAVASLTSQKRYDYYDESALSSMDDNLELHKQKSLYTSHHNDVLTQQPSNNLDLDTTLGTHTSSSSSSSLSSLSSSAKHGLGIKVRLFTLKPDLLPCHDELSDPTELPLSRDLMDVRSNVLDQMSGAAIRAQQMQFVNFFCCILLAYFGRNLG